MIITENHHVKAPGILGKKKRVCNTSVQPTITSPTSDLMTILSQRKDIMSNDQFSGAYELNSNSNI